MYVEYDSEAAVEAVPALAQCRYRLCTVNALAQISGDDFATSAYVLTEALGEMYPGQGRLPGFKTYVEHFHTALRYLGYGMERPLWA